MRNVFIASMVLVGAMSTGSVPAAEDASPRVSQIQLSSGGDNPKRPQILVADGADNAKKPQIWLTEVDSTAKHLQLV